MTDTTEAERLFDEGDELSGRGARAIAAGEADEGRQCYLRAIGVYEAALEAAPEDDPFLSLNLRLCIGARRFGLGETEAAKVAYGEVRKALEARPDLAAEEEGRDLLATARLNQAECDLAAGRIDEARREVEAVLALAPDHPYGPILLERCVAASEGAA